MYPYHCRWSAGNCSTFLFLIVVLLAPLIQFPASAPAEVAGVPSWVQTGGVKQFPPDLYITGIGSGEVISGDTASAQAEADSKAIAQVAKQIRVKIQQQDQSIVGETSAPGDKVPVTRYSVWQQTAASVDLKIEGVRIEDRHFDQKSQRLFSLALFDRMDQGRVISGKISTLETGAEVLMREAEKHKNNIDKVHRSVMAYGLALKKLLQALRFNQYLSIIAPRLSHHGLSRSLSDLESDFGGLLARFSMEVISGDNQTGTIGGDLMHPLTTRVNYDGAPVPSLPIMFGFVTGSGNIDYRARTNENGQASSMAGSLGPTGNTINKIRAYLNYYPSDKELQRELNLVFLPVFAQFTYFLPAVETIRIAVLINEYNMGRRQPQAYLSNQITRELSQARMNILRDIPEEYRLLSFDSSSRPALESNLTKLSGVADIVILGEVKSNVMEGSYSSNLVFSQARAMVKIIDLEKNTELSSVDISAKGAGPSREESGRRTIRKVSAKASAVVAKEVKRVLLGQ